MQQGPVHGTRPDFPIVIATSPPTVGQQRAALIVIALLLIGIAVAVPFAGVPLRRIDAFIPVLQTVMCFADLITASLLFVQYSIQPQRALLVLASGYICGGLFAFLQTLAYPGGYAPAGVIGDGLDTPAWFFVLWHTTFPLAVIVYALSERMNSTANVHGRPVSATIVATIVSVLAIVAVLAWIVTTWVAYLPSMYPQGVTQQTVVGKLANLFVWIMGVAALAILFFRRRSILDLWMMVTLIAWMPNFAVGVVFTFVRFSTGWYVARGYALIASCTVLIVLLTETTVLYARLVAALTLLRRERANRMMSLDAATAAIAHETRQPLSAISNYGAAGLNWLNRAQPDLGEVRQCLDGMISSSVRAENVIASVRALFKEVRDQRSLTFVDDLAREVLLLVRQETQANQISVITDYQAGVPHVVADRTQLQQVILNLIKNAIEAMSAAPSPGERHLRVTTKLNGESNVVLSVEDSGPGIISKDRDRIFEPFFTTKPAGMGLGLAICQTIVEEHGGHLRLVKTDASGSTFEIALPISDTGGARA